MAIIKFGVVVVGARGTIGGMTLSENLSGPFAKTWSKGPNPKSPLQSEQRGLLGTLASSWRALSQAQRDDWDDYAALPPQEKFNSLSLSYFVSGFNWYVAINQNLTAAGEAVRVDAPTLTRPTATIIESAFYDPLPGPTLANIRYTIADPDLAANHVVWGLVVNSQGIKSIPDKMPFLRIAVPDGSRIISISLALRDLFGTGSLSQRLLLRSVIQDAHGQRGPEDTFIEDAV